MLCNNIYYDIYNINYFIIYININFIKYINLITWIIKYNNNQRLNIIPTEGGVGITNLVVDTS